MLSDALDQGASHDVALGVLGRIDRLDAGTRINAAPIPAIRRRALAKPSPLADANLRRGTIAMWWVTAAAIVLVAGLSFVLVAPNGMADWFPVQATTGSGPARRRPGAIASTVPTETYLAQARSFAGGKLRMRCARSIVFPSATRSRPDAERIRADIQRELLAVATPVARSYPPLLLFRAQRTVPEARISRV